jgi:ferredoxin-NADP reductase
LDYKSKRESKSNSIANREAESEMASSLKDFVKSHSLDCPDGRDSSKLDTSKTLNDIKQILNNSSSSFKEKVMNNSVIKSIKNKKIITFKNNDDDAHKEVLIDLQEEENQILAKKRGTDKSSAPFRNSATSRKKSVLEVDSNDELGYLKMYERTNVININTIGIERLWRLKVFIDGPYGTPSVDIFDSEHAVLIAAGIGITPFASILQSLLFRYRQSRAKCPNCDHKISNKLMSQQDKLAVKRVDFIWITREQRSLEWFISIISQMEIEQRKNNESFLETHLYVTSAKRQSDLKTISLQYTIDCLFSEEESHLVDGLRKRTYYGRPNWDIVMQNLIRKQQGKINVFYCGPPALASTLTTKCKQYNLTFKKEVFLKRTFYISI